jgi:hypothetical protein
MRVAIASGLQLTLGSLLVLPRPNRPVPILGADLSWSGARDEMTIAADLTPVRDALERDAELAAIARVVPDVSRLPSGSELADRHAEWRSPSSLHTRVGRVQIGDGLVAFDGYVRAFVTLLGAATPSAERAYQVRAIHQGYLSSRRSDDSLSILGTIFGRAWAGDYVARVLFPSL